MNIFLKKRKRVLDGSFQTFTLRALRSGADWTLPLKTKDSLCQLVANDLTQWKE